MVSEEDEAMRQFEIEVERQLRELMAEDPELWCDEVTLDAIIKDFTRNTRHELIMKMKSFHPIDGVLDNLFENWHDESEFVPPKLIEVKKEHIRSKKKVA